MLSRHFEQSLAASLGAPANASLMPVLNQIQDFYDLSDEDMEEACQEVALVASSKGIKPHSVRGYVWLAVSRQARTLHTSSTRHQEILGEAFHQETEMETLDTPDRAVTLVEAWNQTIEVLKRDLRPAAFRVVEYMLAHPYMTRNQVAEHFNLNNTSFISKCCTEARNVLTPYHIWNTL